MSAADIDSLRLRSERERLFGPGGLIFGALSDVYGRIRVLTWTIVLFAVFTGLCAVASGYWDLLFYRTIAGVGLGGEFGIGMALAAEAWPARHRARVSSYVALGWQLGVLGAAMLTPLLLPSIGWRGMVLAGTTTSSPEAGVTCRSSAPKKICWASVEGFCTVMLKYCPGLDR